jgi:hypothetical protein
MGIGHLQRRVLFVQPVSESFHGRARPEIAPDRAELFLGARFWMKYEAG